MKLKEIVISTKGPLKEMNKQTWCVQEQYWSYLKGYDTGRYQKIVIEIDDDIRALDNDGNLVGLAVDVLVVVKYFDIQGFLSLEDYEKKRRLLELLHATMMDLGECNNWNVELFSNAYKNCIESNLEYRFKVRDKNYKSPTRGFIGYVKCYWDLDKFTATGVISRKDGSILKEETLVEIEPYFGDFIYYANCKWDDAYTFSLYSKEGKKWSIAILSLI